MNLQQIINELDLVSLTEAKEYAAIDPTGGYTSDLLSCVMTGAAHRSLWITLQAHANIVAVASLLDLSAIIITEGAKPDESTIAKANEEKVILLSTNQSSFYVSGKLWELGVRNRSEAE